MAITSISNSFKQLYLEEEFALVSSLAEVSLNNSNQDRHDRHQLLLFGVLNDRFVAGLAGLQCQLVYHDSIVLVYARLVCHFCTSVGAVFANLYFRKYRGVATRFGCGKIFNDRFIANCPLVKQFSKSVNILRRCGQKFDGTFLWFTVYVTDKQTTDRRTDRTSCH